MSDNKHYSTTENIHEEPPPSHRDSSPETQHDSSTDVAPTRKMRKRLENKPPPDVQNSPETASGAEVASKVNQC